LGKDLGVTPGVSLGVACGVIRGVARRGPSLLKDGLGPSFFPEFGLLSPALDGGDSSEFQQAVPECGRRVTFGTNTRASAADLAFSSFVPSDKTLSTKEPSLSMVYTSESWDNTEFRGET